MCIHKGSFFTVIKKKVIFESRAKSLALQIGVEDN